MLFSHFEQVGNYLLGNILFHTQFDLTNVFRRLLKVRKFPKSWLSSWNVSASGKKLIDVLSEKSY
jgi:hypothetical protein